MPYERGDTHDDGKAGRDRGIRSARGSSPSAATPFVPDENDRGCGNTEGGAELEAGVDQALSSAGQDILGRVELPAPVRRRIHNRRCDARGFFFGSALATPASRKIRASDATDGAPIPSERILSCTPIGP